jgi:DNA-binding transcriptional MerR regulator
LNLDSPVTYKGQAFTVAQLIEQAEAGKQAGAMKANIRKVFQEQDANVRSQSLQGLLKDAGFSDDEVSGYMEQFDAEDEPVETPGQRRTQQRPRNDGVGDPDPRLDRVVQTLQADRDEVFTEILHRGAKDAVADGSPLGKALLKTKEWYGDEAYKKSLEVYEKAILDDATRLAKGRLGSKRGQGLSRKDIQDSLAEAQQRAYSLYGAAIPDPSMLGRAGETVSDSGFTSPELPQEAPKFSPKMSRTDRIEAQKELARWNLIEEINKVRAENNGSMV